MNNNKMIAMMLTMSMLAAAFAGCLGGDDEDDTPDWSISMASDVSADFVESAWDPIIPNLNDADMCDAIISAMTKTDEREQVVDFTRAYYTSSQGVIGGSGAASISAVADLNAEGTTIGVQSGTTSDLYAQENLGAATISAYDDFPSVIAALNNGDVHYAMGDAPVLSLEGTLMVTFSDENFGMAVQGDSSGELLGALNMAIGAMVDSGEYDLIYGASFDGAVTLADDTTMDTATSYPVPTEGSDLTAVLESGSLRLCTDPFYPPFESYDDSGAVVGFDADIAHAVADEIAAHYMGAANPMFMAPVADVEIKIGTMYDTTGGLASYATGFEYAVNQAFTDLNAMDDGYHFVNVYADSGGANGQVATDGANSLVSAGVVAVVGAASSGASTAANAVLSQAGVPMISFASTAPSLSDSTAYPHFFRVVPSDALQGEALADLVTSQGYTSTAIIAQNDAYGAGLADAFDANFDGTTCARYDFNQAEFNAAAMTTEAIQAVTDASMTCDSVIFMTYPDTGAQFLGAMYQAGASLPSFGGDGMAGAAALTPFGENSALANGMMTTSPRAGSSSGDFPATCEADAVCSAGIYTSEAYDAVMIAAHAAKMEDGANMHMHIPMVGSGDGYAGASGTHVFLANGDVAGSGYDVCTFAIVPTYGDYVNCMHTWDAVNGVAATPFAGVTVKIGFMGDATSPAIGELWPSFQAAAGLSAQLANAIGYSNNVQFEVVFADSGCNGFETTSTGASAAQTLVDAGVWGVVGAACSGASKAANAILSEAGIPMISYASTSPDLSDATAYPDFFRVVPSDVGQAAALKDLMIMNNEALTADGGVAIIAAADDYTASLGDLFTSEWIAAGGEICTRSDYARPLTDVATAIQSTLDNGCGAVALFAYNSDGAAIITELSSSAFAGQIYGTDGIASVTTADSMQDDLLDGVMASQPGVASSARGMLVQSLWPTTVPMGQFAMEAVDATTIMMFAAFTQLATPQLTPSMAIAATGNGWDGATGPVTFQANGDTLGQGYCIGQFSVTDVGADGEGTVAYDCVYDWSFDNGLVART